MNDVYLRVGSRGDRVERAAQSINIHRDTDIKYDRHIFALADKVDSSGMTVAELIELLQNRISVYPELKDAIVMIDRNFDAVRIETADMYTFYHPVTKDVALILGGAER